MVVPQHCTALGTEAPFRSTHLGWLVVLIKLQGGDIHSNRSQKLRSLKLWMKMLCGESERGRT